MTYNIVVNGVTYTSKYLFEYVDGFKTFGVRITRRKSTKLSLWREGIQITKYADHDRAGGNYYYRIRYDNHHFGHWHKTTLKRLVPIIEKLTARGWDLSY